MYPHRGVPACLYYLDFHSHSTQSQKSTAILDPATSVTITQTKLAPTADPCPVNGTIGAGLNVPFPAVAPGEVELGARQELSRFGYNPPTGSQNG